MYGQSLTVWIEGKKKNEDMFEIGTCLGLSCALAWLHSPRMDITRCRALRRELVRLLWGRDFAGGDAASSWGCGMVITLSQWALPFTPQVGDGRSLSEHTEDPGSVARA